MKVFNVNKLKFTLAGLCGSVMLVGCVGENADNKSTVSNSGKIAQSAQNLHNVNDEKNLWAAITGSDAIGYNSDIRFAIDNNSANDVRFLGCDGDVRQFSTQFESDIYAGYHTGTKLLSDNDPDKNKLDPMNLGVYLPESLEQTQFKFGTGAYRELDTSTEKCYFSVYDASQDEYMYFKMVNDVRVFNTYSAIFNDMKRPQHDAEKVAGLYDSELWAKRLSFDAPTMAAADIFAWGAISSKLWVSAEQLYNETVTSQTQELFSLYARDYNKWRAIYLSRDNSYAGILQAQHDLDYMKKKFFGNSDVLIQTGTNRDIGNAEIRDFVKNFKLELVNDTNSATRLKLVDTNGNSIIPNRADPHVWERYGLKGWQERLPEGPEGLQLKQWSVMQEEYKTAWGVKPKSFGEVVGKDRSLVKEMRELNRVSKLNSRVTTYDELMFSKKLISKAKWMKVGAVAAEAAFIAVDWFVFQPLLDGIFSEPGYGTFNTGIAQLSLDAVTPEEATAWNKNHPDSPIAANTDVIQDDNNNSIMATTQLKFKEDNQKGLDKNSLVTISLSKITTPWLRTALETNDPYLGNVGKFGAKKGSSVFKMTINSSGGLSLTGLENEFNKLYYGSLGLSQLANRDKLPAPEVTVVKSSVASNGGLKSTHNGLQT
ncbi:MAG: hypothetical protein EKK57_04530, partial [Proteobacteria bacterium]